MKKTTTLLFGMLFCFLIGNRSFAQTTLSLGDIAFTACNSDVNDEFTFLLLKDIVTGTQISFTENGWQAAGGFRSGENTVTWTAGDNITCGTQVTISGAIATNNGGFAVGTVSGTALSLSTVADQIFAYQGTEPVAGDESNFIAAIQMKSAWDADGISTTTSAKPSVFTDGVNSIVIGSSDDNALYNCSTTGFSPDDIRAAVNNNTNWNTDNTNPYTQPPLCNFSCSAPANTITIGAIAGTSFCQGAGVDIPFTSSGTFNNGNIYTAQLSDATGSFESLTDIGTLASTANSGTINAGIPADATAGTAYRIRITASDPATTGTDNGADLTIEANSTAPTSVTGSADTICSGTSVSLNASGGIAASGSALEWYSMPGGSGDHLFSGGGPHPVSPASTTTYYVRREGGCGAPTDDAPVIIAVDAPPSEANAGMDQTICDTMATLEAETPVTGTGTWSVLSGSGVFADSSDVMSDVTGLSADSNTLVWTVTNGVCPASADTVKIYVNEPPSAANAGTDQNICDPMVALNANAPDVGTGAWTVASGSAEISDSSDTVAVVSGLSEGANQFVWTISYNNCPASSDTVDIIYNVPLKPDITQIDSLLSSTQAQSYQWFYNGDTIPGATDQEYVALQEGAYVVATVDTNGCEAVSDTLSVIHTSIDDEQSWVIDIFPNPVSDVLNFFIETAQQEPISYRIMNAVGQTVQEGTLSQPLSSKHRIEISALPQGTYLIQIIAGKTAVTRKVFKE